MAIYITTEVDGIFLRVKAEGEDESLSDVMGYAGAVAEAASAGGCTRILCDERALVYRLGIGSTYEAAKQTAEQIPKDWQVAIVPRAEFRQEADFWQTVASNRGMHVRVFQSVEEAETWLMQTPVV